MDGRAQTEDSSDGVAADERAEEAVVPHVHDDIFAHTRHHVVVQGRRFHIRRHDEQLRQQMIGQHPLASLARLLHLDLQTVMRVLLDLCVSSVSVRSWCPSEIYDRDAYACVRKCQRVCMASAVSCCMSTSTLLVVRVTVTAG